MQREETDRMGQMERGHTAEVQPDCMTEAYTVGISETHIRNNATVFRVWQMIECGELTREEGLYLMVNTLADENHRLNQMCNIDLLEDLRAAAKYAYIERLPKREKAKSDLR